MEDPEGGDSLADLKEEVDVSKELETMGDDGLRARRIKHGISLDSAYFSATRSYYFAASRMVRNVRFFGQKPSCLCPSATIVLVPA
jgi:hypothetical protein